METQIEYTDLWEWNVEVRMSHSERATSSHLPVFRVRWLLVLLSFTVGYGGTEAGAQREPGFCMNVQPPLSGADAARTLALLRAMGVQSVRASWWAWSTREDWAFAPLFRQAGIETVPIVYGHYPWSDGSEASYARTIINRYRALRSAHGSFRYVQLDNEPDGGSAWAANRPNPYAAGAAWGRITALAAREIKAMDPETRIVSAGMAWVHPGTIPWLRGFLSTAGDAIDVLAIHVYGDHLWGEPLHRAAEVRPLGWRGPVWATEIGIADWQMRIILGRDGSPPNQAEMDEYQRQNWAAVLTDDPSRHLYERLCGFQFRGEYGVLREDWSLRPTGRFLIERARRATP